MMATRTSARLRARESGTSNLLPLGHGISLVHPVRSEVVGDVKHLHMAEPLGAQSLIRGLHVGTMSPRTTTAVQNDKFIFWQRRYPFPKQLQTCLVGARADVLRTGNVSLHIEHVESHLKNQRLLPRCLQNFHQLLRKQLR